MRNASGIKKPASQLDWSMKLIHLHSTRLLWGRLYSSLEGTDQPSEADSESCSSRTHEDQKKMESISDPNTGFQSVGELTLKYSRWFLKHEMDLVHISDL